MNGTIKMCRSSVASVASMAECICQFRWFNWIPVAACVVHHKINKYWPKTRGHTRDFYRHGATEPRGLVLFMLLLFWAIILTEGSDGVGNALLPFDVIGRHIWTRFFFGCCVDCGSRHMSATNSFQICEPENSFNKHKNSNKNNSTYSPQIVNNIFYSFFFQPWHRQSSLWKAAAQQPAKIQFFSLCYRAVWQNGSAHRNRTYRVHRIHWKGSGLFLTFC